jgi:predicted ribosome quality control (RQC) complex YloA/Tae2 family protein
MSENPREIDEIRFELAGQKYLPPARSKGKKDAPPPISLPRIFTSSDGLKIYVGRNNRQNDQLTLKTASSNDIWLHVKNLPGAHVLVKKQHGEVPMRTVAEAASLAAFFSRAGAGASVSVDYTPAKHVKKPAGARPGMVVYDHYKTLVVTPKEHI